jgi:proteic killer suppression protein
LRQLFERDDARRLPPASVDKLRDMLVAIHAARTVDDIDLVPGWKLHPLKGDLAGCWSLTVTRNWRLTFRFEDGDAFDLDLVDYH